MGGFKVAAGQERRCLTAVLKAMPQPGCVLSNLRIVVERSRDLDRRSDRIIGGGRIPELCCKLSKGHGHYQGQAQSLRACLIYLRTPQGFERPSREFKRLLCFAFFVE